VTAPSILPSRCLEPAAFLDAVEDPDLVYFLLNVGDADCQLVVFPRGTSGVRRAMVVDVGKSGKLPQLIDHLESADFLPNGRTEFEVVAATHPHRDHIDGMPEFLARFGDRVKEYWDSGYRHPVPPYFRVLEELERRRDRIAYAEPTSGFTRFFDRVRVTVLAPAIALRNRYDSYGVDPNNASVCLKLEYPVTRAVQRGDRRFLEPRTRDDPTATRMIMGGDAQLASWSHVLADFPELRPSESPVLKALGMRKGSSPLRAEILKVPHHASKLGLSVELAEMVKARLALVSCVAGGGKHNFPHRFSQDALREAKTPIAKSGASDWPRPDHEIGIHYTSARTRRHGTLGTICLVIKPTARRVHMWRFLDERDDPVDLASAHRFVA
jgi:beta-lactamase superfamily II metal-dependent hydrolase